VSDPKQDAVAAAVEAEVRRIVGDVEREVFVLEGVAFAVLTPKETTIPPIVRVDELIRAKGAGMRGRR